MVEAEAPLWLAYVLAFAIPFGGLRSRGQQVLGDARMPTAPYVYGLYACTLWLNREAGILAVMRGLLVMLCVALLLAGLTPRPWSARHIHVAQAAAVTVANSLIITASSAYLSLSRIAAWQASCALAVAAFCASHIGSHLALLQDCAAHTAASPASNPAVASIGS